MLRRTAAVFALPLFLLSITSSAASAATGTIVSPNQYAGDDSGGYVNWDATGSNVTVCDTGLTGYIWSAGFGGINLSPTNGGVVISANTTTTPNSIFEVSGQQYISTKLGIATTSPATNLAVSGSSYFTGGLGIGTLNTAAGALAVSGDTTLANATSTNLASSLLSTNANGSIAASLFSGPLSFSGNTFTFAQLKSTSNTSLLTILKQLVTLFAQELTVLIKKKVEPPSSSMDATEPFETSSAPAPGRASSTSFSGACASFAPVIDQEGNPSFATTDGTHVYDQFCSIIPNVNPSTFVALSRFYGKDKNGVYILGGQTRDDTDLLPGIVLRADPTTFALIPDPNQREEQPDLSPPEYFSDEYTKDKNHIYAYGQVVEGADLNTFEILFPQVEPVRLSSTTEQCIVDAKDDKTKYYWGGSIRTEDVYIQTGFCNSEG